MTLEELKSMPPHTVFATGVTSDDRLFREPVRWIAKRGYIHDWAIYYDREERTLDEVASRGSKVYSPGVIKDLVSCDEEMMKMYRL